MGWRGTVRSLSAAARRAERDAERRHKQWLKEQEIADAADAVEAWQDYVDGLVSVHVDLADAIDWHSIASEPEPLKPDFMDTHQLKAQAKLASFKPGIFDFLKGGSTRKKRLLEDALAKAPELDQKDFKKSMDDYHAEYSEWEEDTKIARRLMAGEQEAFVEVIKEMNMLERESLIGSAVEFSIVGSQIHARPEVHTDEIIPNFRRKQTATGKLSETKMPAGQFNELYQDYVCSVALKVAGDLFHIVPVDEVYITCMSMMLNSSTGHQELTPILSVQAVRSTFLNLNLEHLDPSDSMANFNHNMKFRKTKGFAPVDPLIPIAVN